MIFFSITRHPISLLQLSWKIVGNFKAKEEEGVKMHYKARKGTKTKIKELSITCECELDLSFSLQDKHKHHFKCLCAPDCKQRLHGPLCVFINLLPLMTVHAFLHSLNICSAKPTWRLRRHRGLLMAVERRGGQHIHPTHSILDETHFHTSLSQLRARGRAVYFWLLKRLQRPIESR